MCVCVCVCVCVRLCASVFLSVSVCVRESEHMFEGISVCVCEHVCLGHTEGEGGRHREVTGRRSQHRYESFHSSCWHSGNG